MRSAPSVRSARRKWSETTRRSFLMLRRRSLTGDATVHAILPGAVVCFLVSGLSLGAMTVGGMVAGLGVALLSWLVSRLTVLREGASMAVFHLISLAAGVLIVSLRGSYVDLLHVLFGTVLALDDGAPFLRRAITTLGYRTLAALFRALVMDCAGPRLLRSVSGLSAMTHIAFRALVVVSLVAGYQALGTLMAMGRNIPPAARARLWAAGVGGMIGAAVALAVATSWAGLLGLPCLPDLRPVDHPLGGRGLRPLGPAWARAGHPWPALPRRRASGRHGLVGDGQ